MINKELKNFYTYSGVIHIHTIHSDGTGNIRQIVKFAKNAGLDWIIVTDHNNMDVEEGYIDNFLVIKGEEISPLGQNHYLAFGLKQPIIESNPEIFVPKVRELGGFGFIAHPDESDERRNKNRPIKWLNDEVIPDGVEIWNWFSQWADNYNDSNLLTMAYAYFNRNALITVPSEKTLKRWDNYNNMSKKIIPAIGGMDAHSLNCFGFLKLKIFPYSCMMKKFANIIHLTEPLSKNFDKAKSQVLTAIHAGNNIIVNRQICNDFPKIYVENSQNYVCCGSEIKYDDSTYINVNLPRETSIKIVRNGEDYHKIVTKTYKMKLIEGGKYRVEGIINNKGYFYTNPIVVVQE